MEIASRVHSLRILEAILAMRFPRCTTGVHAALSISLFVNLQPTNKANFTITSIQCARRAYVFLQSSQSCIFICKLHFCWMLPRCCGYALRLGCFPSTGGCLNHKERIKSRRLSHGKQKKHCIWSFYYIWPYSFCLFLSNEMLGMELKQQNKMWIRLSPSCLAAGCGL